ASIETFGFTNPVLIDEADTIIAGHGRLAAAKQLGLGTVPTIRLSHLSQNEKRALAVADNKIALNASWDLEILAGELQHLSSLELDLDLGGLTGFDTAEIDNLVLGTGDPVRDPIDESPLADTGGEPVSQLGDLWQLGPHRLLCGDALKPESYEALLGAEKAQLVITDPPFNVRMRGHAGGLGKVRHREFPMASGEMRAGEFTTFLETAFRRLSAASGDGSIHFVFMDWRHMREILAASASSHQLINLVVWDKGVGGMGSLYRSRHELVFVFKSGRAPHQNNVALGAKGRYRTNVWAYAGANSFGRARADLALHPTVKPVAMIADAIRDCSARNALVLDPFAGSGTILLACERTRRRARAIELDPLYADVAIRRFEQHAGVRATLSFTGESFEEVSARRTTERASVEVASPVPNGIFGSTPSRRK
ncbi:MAG: ParB N-terminal domain-containing protein, partial [Bauldia sp.]|nr:ParB N-terminal domain-containing protein [Bauldia sp.]